MNQENNILKQKIRKLANLHPKEIAFRIKEKGYQAIEYVMHQTGYDQLDCNNIAKVFSYNYSFEAGYKLFCDFKTGKRNIFFTESYNRKERVDFIKKNADYQKCISQAEYILSGELLLLGKLMKIPSGKGWQIDPLKNVKWPDTFYAKAAKLEDCDIKYIWEVNRHQYLIVLAKAYVLTGNKKYAKKVFSVIQDWIDSNPYNRGVNWTSSLELAVRVISWIWACFLCVDSGYLTAGFYAKFIKSVYEHGKYIRNHLSFYSSPYNHLIGEVAALHLIGSLFPQLKKGKNWENFAWHILEDQVEKQFHEDGMCVEQATFYHHFTLGFYLQAILIRRLNNKEVCSKIYSRIEKALEFSMYMTKPDGTLPMFGDIDNARSIYFNNIHSWDFRGFLGIGAVLFKRADFKEQCGGLPEELIWMMNDNDLKLFLNMKTGKPNAISVPFYKSGYFIFRDSWANDSHYLCFDCGEISEGLHADAIPSAAHGHADALSFELSAYGRAFIVDGGFYTYFGPLKWHKYFRHEEAHNTLRINSYRQAEYCGRLKWQNVNNPVFNEWQAADSYNYVSGNFSYSGDKAYHERQIVYIKKKFWFFNDTICVKDINESDEVHIFLNFDPNVELVSLDKINRKIILKNQEAGIFIKYFRNLKIIIEKGGTEPSCGWIGKGYGIRHPGFHIRLTKRLEKKKEIFPMLIIPWQKSHHKISDEKIHWNEKSLEIFATNVNMGDDTFSISVKKNSNIRIEGNDLLVDIKSKILCYQNGE